MADATITSRSRSAAARLDDGGASAENSTVKGKGAAGVGSSSKSSNGQRGHAALRTVTSESWDDDFLFQHSSTSDLHLPLGDAAPTRSRGSPKRIPSTSSHTQSVSSTSVSYLAPPPQTPRLALRPHANPSLDSLASSAWGSEDPDPTLTFTQPTPTASHQTTPRRAPSRHPTEDDFRSTTPSLTYSTGAATAAELTEAETFLSDFEDDGARTSVEIEDARPSWTRSSMKRRKGKEKEGAMRPPPLPGLNSRGRGGGGSKKWRTTLSELFGSPGAAGGGRRTGPREVLPASVVGETLQTPPGAAQAQLVVLGQRQRASAGSSSSPRSVHEHWRRPHSSLESNTSQSTNSSYGSSFVDSTDARSPRRLSLDFLYSNKRKSSSSSRRSDGPPLSPSASSNSFLFSSSSGSTWREHDDSVTSGGEDTTSAGEGDESDVEPGRMSQMAQHPRRGILTPSTSFTGTASPQGRWTGSQVSFASSASAFGLHKMAADARSVVEYADDDGDEAEPERRRRKLVRKREGSGGETLGGNHDRASRRDSRPLLSVSRGSSMTSGSGSGCHSAGGGLGSSFQQQQDEAMAFARESEDESGQVSTSSPFLRRRSVTTGSVPSSISQSYRGSVVEVDPEADPDAAGWLAVAPFPGPSPPIRSNSSRTTLSSSHSQSKLSTSPAATVRNLLRRSSSSKPPVTGKTQAALRGVNNPEKVEKEKRPPLSFSNMLSRSASSLPLGKRAPSPAPTTASSKSSILTRGRRSHSIKSESVPASLMLPPSPRSPRRAAPLRSPTPPPPLPTSRSSRLLHRQSASVETPRSESSTLFISRARALSRPSRPITVLSPPTPTSSPQVAAQRSIRTPLKVGEPAKGRLNESWTMPTGAQRPQSAISTFSDVSESSTLRARPRLPSTTSFLDTKPTRRALSPAPKGHRQSLSLSSALPTRPPLYAPSAPTTTTPGADQRDIPRPRTAMGVDRPASHHSDDSGFECLVRRNSLSDLKIPSRITSSQARIEEDLERVKEFARGIEALKALRLQYQHLVKTAASPPASPEPKSSTGDSPSLAPSNDAVGKLKISFHRIELDYKSWWEQAEALVDLGDGKPPPKEVKESPGTLASKRDRCVSLAPSPPREITGSETETEETQKRKSPAPSAPSSPTTSRSGSTRRPRYLRRPSASSMETAMSVEERQKEMLRGVLLNPALKGASLPSRGPLSPRPGLAILTEPRSTSLPTTKPVPLGLSSSPSTPHPLSSPTKGNLRRVSRAGVSGIKDFLLRLRMKASEELAASVNTPQLNHLARDARGSSPLSPEDGRRSVSDPARSLTPSHSRYGSLRRRQPLSTPLAARPRPTSSSSEEEDWDRESSPPSLPGSISARGTQASSKDARASIQSTSGGVERMVLTTEAMPSLLLKVREVQERCEECVGRLKGLTV